PSPVQHYWSLSIEEQFYIVWPPIMIAGAALARRASRAPRSVLAPHRGVPDDLHRVDGARQRVRILHHPHTRLGARHRRPTGAPFFAPAQRTNPRGDAGRWALRHRRLLPLLLQRYGVPGIRGAPSHAGHGPRHRRGLGAGAVVLLSPPHLAAVPALGRYFVLSVPVALA